jgi:hypothetical protein
MNSQPRTGYLLPAQTAEVYPRAANTTGLGNWVSVQISYSATSLATSGSPAGNLGLSSILETGLNADTLPLFASPTETAYT